MVNADCHSEAYVRCTEQQVNDAASEWPADQRDDGMKTNNRGQGEQSVVFSSLC